jgi:thiosulfate/3-mercaptopyruvate sulfurtransferase
MPADGPIVGPAWLAERLGDERLRVIEVDVSSAAYDEGHIAGALLWNAYSDLRDGNYMPIALVELEALLARSGITPETTLVFCGYGALLGFWLMGAHGHARTHVLSGSREQWGRACGGLSIDVGDVTQSEYALPAADGGLLATRADVERAIGDRRCVLLDVRSDAEFAGERFWPSGADADAGSPGHLPGAVSVPIDLLRNDDDTLKSPAQLRSALDGAGVDGEQRVIVYCTIGNRASQAWFALKHLLDFPEVSVYYASWAEWGRASDTRIEV